MKLETNFVQVQNNPAVVNKVNTLAAAWGWTVQSVQVTDTAVAYESGAIGWTTEFGTFVQKSISVNRTTYASITYQRDKDDPKYSQWVALENEYNEAERNSFITPEESQKLAEIEQAIKKADKLRLLVAFILVGVFIYVVISFPFLYYIMFLAGIVLLITQNWRIKKKIEKDAEYCRIHAAAAKRKDEAKAKILARAEAL